MQKYIALLRAVNVGGTGKLPMIDLRKMCADAGFKSIETYIASGNVVFDSNAAPATVKAELESRLQAYSGKPVSVLIRTTTEMAAVLKANPFDATEPKHTNVIFLDERPQRDALKHAVGRVDEEMQLGRQEFYVAYPNGIGHSKLRIPAAKNGTARNLNTVAKLVQMASTT